MRSIRGFSTLELLVAISISIPLLIALALAFKGEVETYRIFRKQDALESALFRTEKLLQHSVLDFDSASWAPSLRIHRRGRINYVDGSSNPIMSANPLRQPLSTSDALTSARFDLEHALAVRSAHLQGRVLSVTACPRFTSSTQSPPVHSVLAMTTDDAFELTAQQGEMALGSSCQTLRLRATKSMLTNTASLLDLRLVRVLVPILQLRTLYIDKQNQLRYLAHRGIENIENQALLSGLKGLALTRSVARPWRFLSLHAEIRDKGDGILEFDALSSFERGVAYNFYLNTP